MQFYHLQQFISAFPPHCKGLSAVVCTIFLQLLIAIIVNSMTSMEFCQQMQDNYLMVSPFWIVTKTWFLLFMCYTKLRKEIISVRNCQIRCYLVCINKVVHKWELIYLRVCSFHIIMSFVYNQCLKHLMFHSIKKVFCQK